MVSQTRFVALKRHSKEPKQPTPIYILQTTFIHRRASSSFVLRRKSLKSNHNLPDVKDSKEAPHSQITWENTKRSAEYKSGMCFVVANLQVGLYCTRSDRHFKMTMQLLGLPRRLLWGPLELWALSSQPSSPSLRAAVVGSEGVRPKTPRGFQPELRGYPSKVFWFLWFS